MARRIRRRRSRQRSSLGGLLLPAIVGVFSVFIATHYAVDWGKEPSAEAVIAAGVPSGAIASVEDAIALESFGTVVPLPIPSATSGATPQAPTLQASPTIRAVSPSATAVLLGAQPLARVPFTPDFPLAAEVSARIASLPGHYGLLPAEGRHRRRAPG